MNQLPQEPQYDPQVKGPSLFVGFRGPLAAMTDEELVRLFQASTRGDGSAFAQLVERHQSRILANCRYISRSPNDAEDLAQEVFTKAYFALGRFEGRSSFKTWIQRIKINHCLNYVEKKRGKHFQDLEDLADSEPEKLSVSAAAERDLESKGHRELIGKILDSMSDNLRIPLVLRDVDGENYQDIADQLGIGLSAVKMRIKRGREIFRTMWDEALQEAEA